MRDHIGEQKKRSSLPACIVTATKEKNSGGKRKPEQMPKIALVVRKRWYYAP